MMQKPTLVSETGITRLWEKNEDNRVIWRTVYLVVEAAVVTEAVDDQEFPEVEVVTHQIEIQVVYKFFEDQFVTKPRKVLCTKLRGLSFLFLSFLF